MARFTSVLDRMDSITNFVGAKAGYVVLLLMGSLVYEVVSRYAWNRPTIWSYEITYMSYGIHFLIGLSFTLLYKAHIRIDVFYNLFPPRVKAVVDILGYFLIFFPAITIMTISAYHFFLDSYRINEVSQFTPWAPILWPYKGVMFLAFALLLLQGVTDFLRNVMKVVEGESHD